MPPELQEIVSRALVGADLTMARVMLVERLAGSVLRKEVVAALERFIADPTTATAQALVREEPTLAGIFVASRMTRAWREQHGMPTDVARPNAALLRQEPRFQQLVDALANNRLEYSRLVDSLGRSGYTEATLSEAISRHFEDLE